MARLHSRLALLAAMSAAAGIPIGRMSGVQHIKPISSGRGANWRRVNCEKCGKPFCNARRLRQHTKATGHAR